MKNVVNRFKGKRSASAAKDRLKLILVHDRTHISPSVMDKLRDELIEVISRHMDVNRDAVMIEMTQDGRQQRLLADIPIKPKDRRKQR